MSDPTGRQLRLDADRAERRAQHDPATLDWLDRWAAAKQERDAALAALTDPESGRYTDQGAAAAVRARWAGQKALLLATQPARED